MLWLGSGFRPHRQLEGQAVKVAVFWQSALPESHFNDTGF
jgi:hypothetical protein